MPLTQDIRQRRYEQAAARSELLKKIRQGRKAKKEQMQRNNTPQDPNIRQGGIIPLTKDQRQVKEPLKSQIT